MKKLIFRVFVFTFLCLPLNGQTNMQQQLFDLNTGARSGSVSFENPTGEKGQGGKTSNHLGVGRKGFPARVIAPGETVILCDLKGPGTIRHIWMTGNLKENRCLRSTVIRAYWDGQKHPSIECPLGDFMGLAHAKVTSYQSAVHSVGQNAALNFWLPMPFMTGGKITLTNDSKSPFTLFYQIDYTINDKYDKGVGRLHVCFRRENPTTLKNDFEIMPQRNGKGRFAGAVLGIRTLYPDWWGEGEIKFYMDGDTEFPTICGTGSEDYVCLSYGIQNTTFMYHGCNLLFSSDSIIKVRDYFSDNTRDLKRSFISMYRWHLPDPVYWEISCRITIQQIGWGNVKGNLFERQDDWSSAAFWYEQVPSAPLPPFPTAEERTKDLDELFR